MRFPDISAFLTLGGPLRVIAHRGFSAEAPENTLPAFEKAVAVGGDMIECDVQLSADGEVVVIHDESLDRTTNGRGLVAQTTLTDLRRLDAGAWFSSESAGTPIPSLEELLALARGRILLNVELKPAVDGARALSEAVVKSIRRAGMGTRTILSSFEPDALRWARSLAPEIARGALFSPEHHTGLSPAAILDEVGSSALNLSVAEVSQSTVQACHGVGRAVAVYTVNDPAQAEELCSIGVDAIFTDRPDVMLGGGGGGNLRRGPERHPHGTWPKK